MPDTATATLKLTFDAVYYHVTDMERSIGFYRDILGFPLSSRDYVARFDIDGVLFELVPTAPGTPLSGTGNARLSLGVKDIQEATRALQAKGVSTTPVRDEPGGRLSYFKDPDGNELCLWQPTSKSAGKEFRTVNDAAGMPILEIVKSKDGTVTIFEADDMDNKLQFPASMISSLVQQIETLK